LGAVAQAASNPNGKAQAKVRPKKARGWLWSSEIQLRVDDVMALALLQGCDRLPYAHLRGETLAAEMAPPVCGRGINGSTLSGRSRNDDAKPTGT
jgi:hypothetical protein